MTTSNPILLAFAVGLILWITTGIGAAAVFLHRAPSRRALDTALGFAAGVMLAAAYWSLLAPAITAAREQTGNGWFAPTVGFMAGGLLLWTVDRTLPHLHPGLDPDRAEGVKTPWQRATLLLFAWVLHHIPEGLAVGVSFGAAAVGSSAATLGGAVALAVGLAVQSLPEDAAVAASLRREGFSAARAFGYSQASAIVLPVAAAVGAALVVYVAPLLPYALGFAAGAMIFIVFEQLVPECQAAGDTDAPTLGALIGFALMMALDVWLG